MKILTPCLLVLLLFQGACGRREASPRESRADAAIREGILLRGNGPEVESLDPHLATSVSAGNVLINLFEGLTRLHPETLAPEPAIAERWDISEDGLRYTFHLRESTWSDGTPLGAEDFAYSFRRLLNPALAASYASMLFPIQNARTLPEELGVEVIDVRTLQITLERPTPYFLSLLAHWSAFPVPRHVLEKWGGADSRSGAWIRPENMVVNGPFLLTEWQPERVLRIRRNPRYWDIDSVRLQGADYMPIPVPETEERAFRGGDLHLTYTLPRHRLSAWREQRPEALRVDPYLESVGYVVRLAHPQLSDVRVREALSLALDRRLLVDKVLYAVREPAFSYVPPGTAGYQPSFLLQENREKARALLAAAGFPGGKGLPPLNLIFSTGQDTVRIAEVIQQQWREALGVEIVLNNLERQTYFQMRKEGNFDLCFFGWTGDFVDPETFLGLWISGAGTNYARWQNPAYDDHIASANHSGPERMKRLQEAEKILLQEFPIIPLYFGATQFLKDPRLQGWYPNLLDQHPLRAVYWQE